MGRHLAWTQKAEKCYEWGIYVAAAEMPRRETFEGYKIVQEYDVEAHRFGGNPNLVHPDLVIASEQEFDTWVPGAMAAVSEKDKAPDHVTYQNVLQLAKEIRHSLTP
jgi:hypothetical protein